MSGLSDVRVVLNSQEMQAEQRGARIKAVTSVPNGFKRWEWFWQRLNTRRQLLTLTPEQLHDIGLDAEQARNEGMKSFWQR